MALQTLLTPRLVAEQLLALRLSREVIVLAFALVVVLNTLIVTLMQTIGYGGAPMPFVVGPVVMVVMLAGMLATTMVFMTWVGRLMGGSGQIEDVAILLIWLQALRALGQVIVAVAALISGALASMLVIMALVVGIWILVQFLAVAHRFDSVLRALLVLVFGSVALVIALSLLFSFMGFSVGGMAANV